MVRWAVATCGVMIAAHKSGLLGARKKTSTPYIDGKQRLPR
jgi:hypothetical protein